MKSLEFPRMDARVNNVKKALNNTCTWLFRHKHFAEWHSGQTLRQHNGFLWIKGKPGCGKSTIMKTTLEWAQTQSRRKTTDWKVIHYFFNARASNSLEKSTLGLYRFLVPQLLDLYPALQSHFMVKFAHKDPEQPCDAWTKNELQDFLCDVVNFGEACSVYIFIDALDEGEEQRDVRDMINFLVDLSESALDPHSSLNLRICLSSRHYPHVSVKKSLLLSVEDQHEHDRDIETYVRRKLLGEEGTTSAATFATEELAAEVCRRSASIFLWVVIVVRLLHEVGDRGGSPGEARVLLDTIPNDLNELFENILTRSKHDMELCIVSLQWVLFAQRSLRPDELYLATEYSRSPADTTCVPSSQTIVPSEDSPSLYILECSRGLVELTTAQPPSVQFIHETVRDYLLKSNGLASLLPTLSTNFIGTSQEVLKIGCSRYSTQSSIPGGVLRFVNEGYSSKGALGSAKDRLRLELPFIDYSVSFVLSHAEQAQIHGIQQKNFLRDFASEDGNWEGKHRSWRGVFERYGTRKTGVVTLSYLLAEQRLPHLLEVTIKMFCNVNFSDRSGRFGTALSAACMCGSEDAARLLIVNGAAVNDTRAEHGHALLSAIYSKDYSLIPILQAGGASLKEAMLRKALFEIIARGSTQGVVHLLRLGADVQ